MKSLYLNKFGVYMVMMLTSFTTSAYDFDLDEIFYSIISNELKTVEVVNNGSKNSYSGDVVIPSSVTYQGEEYSVKRIKASSFWGSTLLTSVTIPESIDSIGSSAFSECTNLKYIKITSLDNWCSLRCSSTYALSYGARLLLNGETVTDLSALTENCHIIGEGAFRKYKYLTTANIPNSVEYIGRSAFYECTNLETLIIPAKVNNIDAIQGCTAIKNLILLDSENYISFTNDSSVSLNKCPIEFFYKGRQISATREINPDTVYYNTEIADISTSNTAPYKVVYCGSKVKELTIPYSAKCYIFSNQVKKVKYLYKNKDVYIIDKSSPSEAFNDYLNSSGAELQNLADPIGLPETNSFDYGEYPLISSENFSNNVTGSEISMTNEINRNVGTHDKGICLKFEGKFWSDSIIYPYTYSINKVPLTIIANDVSRKYGEENPELTCSYFGFKNNETSADLKTLPTIETTATIESNVGTYPIIPYGAASQNYDITHERGTLTITKADQLIEWEQDFGDISVGDIVELEAKSSAGLQIKYTVTDESIAEIFTQSGKKCVEFLKEGKVSIRANQEGNENYNEADRVSKTITVLPQSGVETILADNTANIRVYNLNGSYISDSLYNLCPGFYIVKQGTKMKKVVIK